MTCETNSFRLTYGTYLAYIRHYRYQKSWGYRAVTFSTLGVLFALWLFFQHESYTDSAPVLLVVMGALAFYYFVILDYLFPILGFYSARKRGCYVHPCKVYIDEGHIWSIDPDTELKKPWKSIETIATTRSHIFIYFNKCAAFLIPKNVFNSNEEAESFLHVARQFQDHARKSLS